MTRAAALLALAPFVVPFALAAQGCSDDAESSDAGPLPTTTTTATSTSTSTSTPPDGSAPPDGSVPDTSVPDAASFPDPIQGVAPATLVKGGYQFLEGPQWLPAENKLVFSDVQGNRILQLTPPSTEPTDFRNPSAGANGNAIDKNGLLYTCEHTGKRVARRLANGTVETAAGMFGGAQLNSPNDVIVRSDGTVYFTDPNYAGNTQPKQNVFRLPPGGALAVVDDTLEKPNGIALSPDEKSLYVAVASAKTVRKYAVSADGSTGAGATFVTTTGTSPDGIAVDDAGNLYAATSVGVEVFKPDGTRVGAITVPMQPANLAFGGADRRTLYVTARTGPYSTRVNVPGPP